MIARFFHRLWHYHCTECIEEELHSRVCTSCETLKQQLALVNQEKQQLLVFLTEKYATPIEPIEVPAEKVQITPKLATWGARKAELERADREKAAVLARHSTEVAELEKS
jgi:hypothetical protein